jgi:hypothetical protein
MTPIGYRNCGGKEDRSSRQRDRPQHKAGGIGAMRNRTTVASVSLAFAFLVWFKKGNISYWLVGAVASIFYWPNSISMEQQKEQSRPRATYILSTNLRSSRPHSNNSDAINRALCFFSRSLAPPSLSASFGTTPVYALWIVSD